MNAITSNMAKQNLDHLIEKVVKDVEPTIICNDKGEKAVLLSLETFNAWEETNYLLANPANAEHLRKSIQQDKMGNTTERELIEK